MGIMYSAQGAGAAPMNAPRPVVCTCESEGAAAAAGGDDSGGTGGAAAAAAAEGAASPAVCAAHGLLVYLRVEEEADAVPVRMPVDVMLSEVKAAAHEAGGPPPHRQIVAVGDELVRAPDEAVLAGTPSAPLRNGAVVSVHRHDVRCAKTVSVGDGTVMSLLADGAVLQWDRSSNQSHIRLPGGMGVTSVHVGGGFIAALSRGEVLWSARRAEDAAQLREFTDDLQRQLHGKHVVCCSAGGWGLAAVDSDGVLHICGSSAAKAEFGQIPAHLQGRVAAVACGSAPEAGAAQPAVPKKGAPRPSRLVAVITRDGGVVATGGGLDATEADLGRRIAVSVSAGDRHFAVVLDDGSVRCFGDDSHGQCKVPKSVRDVVACECAGDHTVAVLVDGSVVCWGKAEQLVVGRQPSPYQLQPGGCFAVAASADCVVVASVASPLTVFSARRLPVHPDTLGRELAIPPLTVK